MSVRVRFAPSPTGYLHVGGLRTALYNYLFAKKHNGKCILRIEDTDRTRLVENATEKLIESLSWAGVVFDESPINPGEFGPYIQSERLDIYKIHIDKLLESASAYYAFDTPEEMELMRTRMQQEGKDPKYDRKNMRNQLTLGNKETNELLQSGHSYVVRLLVPDSEIVFSDIIRGEIRIHGKDMDDQVLLKSDGYPTYHLANVVDDHLMKITHVIRGEEWLPSTPKHVLLYKFFGWDLPQFAHLPLLLNKDKSKLSKRQGDVAVEDYITKGYFKDAFVNFIALLGWNPTADREIYSINELIDLFNLEKVNKAGAVFDLVKLNWMNSYYLHHIIPVEELAKELQSILSNRNTEQEYLDYDYLIKTITLFRERLNFLNELPDYAKYMFSDSFEYDIEYKNKHWKEDTEELLKELFDLLSHIDNFRTETLHDKVKSWVDEKQIKFKEIIHPLRFVITGKSIGAGMFETMDVLGKNKCLRRFRTYFEQKR